MKKHTIFFILILESIICYPQSSTIDSLRSKHDTIWISDRKGSIGYLRTKNDSLYLGDVSGEYTVKRLSSGISDEAVKGIIKEYETDSTLVRAEYVDMADDELQQRINNIGAIQISNIYYVDHGSSDIPAYERLLRSPQSLTENNEVVGISGNTILFDSYATEIGEPDVSSIPAGLWMAHGHFTFSSITGNNYIHFDVYKRSSLGVETLLFRVSTDDIGTTNQTEYQLQTVQPEFTLSVTDRIILKIRAQTTGGAKNATFTYGGSTNFAFFQPPLNVNLSDGLAIHTNQSNEIGGLTAKAIPVDNDVLLIEDSQASYAKKKVLLSNVRPINISGTPTAYKIPIWNNSNTIGSSGLNLASKEIWDNENGDGSESGVRIHGGIVQLDATNSDGENSTILNNGNHIELNVGSQLGIHENVFSIDTDRTYTTKTFEIFGDLFVHGSMNDSADIYRFKNLSSNYFRPSKNYLKTTPIVKNPVISIIGDSRTDALSYYIPAQCNNWKQPVGYTPFRANGTSGGRYKMVINGTNYVGSNFRNEKEFGISGSVAKLTNADYIKFTTDSANGNVALGENRAWYDKMVIYWLASPEMGTFRYSFNEGSWTTVTCTTATGDSLGYTIIPLVWQGTMPYKRIRIEGLTDTCYMYGISTDATMFQDRMVVHNISQGGTGAYQWQLYSKYWKGFIKYIQPTQVNVSHGSNDIGSSRTATQYITDIKTIIDNCASMYDKSNYIVWTQFDKGTDSGYTSTDEDYRIKYNDQRIKILAYANLYDWSVFDERKLFPDAQTIADLGYWSDGIHLSTNGNVFIANKMRDILVPFSEGTSNLTSNNTNYLQKSSYMYQSNNIYGTAAELGMWGWYTQTSIGGIVKLGGFYMPNSNSIYTNITGTEVQSNTVNGTIIETKILGRTVQPATYAPLTGTSITIANAYIDNKTVIRVVGNSAPVTITAITGGVEGQVIELHGGSATNTVTITAGSTILLPSSVVILGSGDVLTLRYMSYASRWECTSWIDNL